jgi:peptide/nickel transport system permease protein
LDKPIWQQYLYYLNDILHFDFNYSISNYPRTVTSMMADALPWTIGLLLTTTLFSFFIGTFMGAFLGWPRAPRWLQFFLPPLIALHAIPFFLLGLILIFLFTLQVQIFPMFGGYKPGTLPSSRSASSGTCSTHATLPACRSSWSQWADGPLGMRAMMVTTQGEDYTIFADAKGLLPSRSSSGTRCATRSCRRLRHWRWCWDTSCRAP